MRKAVVLMSVLAGLAVFAAPARADLTVGVWARGDGAAKVRVSPCGDALCAVNVWIRNPGSENVGDRLIMKLRTVRPGVMEGSAYDPQRNLTLSSQITLDGDRMVTRGCVLGGLICRTASWTRE